jgi:glutathione S-transferase
LSGEEEEEDWWLLDQVATSSHLVKSRKAALTSLDILHTAGLKIKFESDAAKKAELKEKYIADTMPKFLTCMEKRLEENGGQFLVGNGVTWADIAVAIQLTLMDVFEVEWKKTSPKIEAFQAKIYNLPNIKAWIAKRPVNSM